MRSDMDHTDLPAHHACLYSPAAKHHRPLAGTHFTVPRRVESWVDLGGGLHTEIKCRLRESNPDTVTHPSTTRAQRRLTSLIETQRRYHYATPSPPGRWEWLRVSHLWHVMMWNECDTGEWIHVGAGRRSVWHVGSVGCRMLYCVHPEPGRHQCRQVRQ